MSVHVVVAYLFASVGSNAVCSSAVLNFLALRCSWSISLLLVDMPAKKRKAPGGNRTGPKPKAGADAVVDATANNSPSKVGSAEATTPPKVDFAPKVLPSVAANNRKLVDRVIKFQSVILNDPAFSDIETAAPLSMATASNLNADTTSFRVGYTNDAYTRNMTTHGKFECNYNLLHFDHMSSPTSMAPRAFPRST